VRVFDPPAIKGKIGRYDPVKKKMVSDVPAQPNLQASREVDIPTEADGFWRSFVERNRARAVEGRPQPMARNQYIPMEEVVPERPGIVGMRATLEQTPISHFEEGAKRAFGQEGFLRGSKYLNAKAAAEDPVAQFYRKGYGTIKGSVEDALSVAPGLRDRFIAAKDTSQVARVFEDAAKDLAHQQMLTRTGQAMRGSPRGAIWNKLTTGIARKARPYEVLTNEAIEKIAASLPHNTDAATRALVIEMLRQKGSP
jgi:hypothetical protein